MTDLIGPGAVRVDGTVEVWDGRNWRVMPPTLDPLTVALRQFLATNPAPCDVCGRYDCQCSAPDADPHGDLSAFSDYDLPY